MDAILRIAHERKKKAAQNRQQDGDANSDAVVEDVERNSLIVGPDGTITVRNNALYMVRTLTVFSTLLASVLCGIFWCMVFLRGEDGSDLEQSYSPTLIAFSVFATAAGVLSWYDLWKTWHNAPDIVTPVPWVKQHASSVRLGVVFGTNTLLLFPSLSIFLLHSTGNSFWDLYADLPSKEQELVGFIIASYVMTLVMTMAALAVTAHALKYRYDAQWQLLTTPPGFRFVVSSKLTGLYSLVAVISFFVALVRANQQDHNSGTVIAVVLHTLLMLAIVFYSMLLVARPMTQNKSWFLAYRSAHLLQSVIAYLAFWVCLISVMLDSSDRYGDGFWATVDKMTDKRQSLIHVQVACYVLLLCTSLYRLFLHKLRKTGRLQRVLSLEDRQEREAHVQRAEARHASLGNGDGDGDGDGDNDYEVPAGKARSPVSDDVEAALVSSGASGSSK